MIILSCQVNPASYNLLTDVTQVRRTIRMALSNKTDKSTLWIHLINKGATHPLHKVSY